MSGSARSVAQRALLRIDGEESFASAVLDEEMARTKLDARDRGLATELVYGVLRHRNRLDRALAHYAAKGIGGVKRDVRAAMRLAAYQILFLDRVPDRAAVHEAVAMVQHRGRRVSGFVNGLLRALVRDGEPALESEGDIPEWAIRDSMPDALVAELVARIDGPELDAASAGLNARPPLWLRANALVTRPEELAARLAADGIDASVEHGAVRSRAGGSPEMFPGYADGAFAVQDLGAQLVGRLTAPSAGARILDACAGRGGKTLHLAELVGSSGRVDAVELSSSKLAQLDEQAHRLGLAERIRRFSGDAAEPIDGVEGEYDVVVIDAPCTGIGVLRRHPELKWRWQNVEPARLEAAQRRLLGALADRVRQGGVLVYAVCSFRHGEGIEQVDWLLRERGDFSIDPPPDLAPVAPGARGEITTWPHRHDADAFFMARLRRG